MTKIVINGSKGRMGTMLRACAPQHHDIKVVGQIDRKNTNETMAIINTADVVVDFSSHEATPSLAGLCEKCHKALVVGTTGHSDGEKALIHEHAKFTPIVMASNFSIGANILFYLTRKTAEILGPEFDLEVVEMHHRHKKDAPSGTAQKLLEILTAVHQLQLDGPTVPRFGRKGIVGERDRHEIGVHSIRGGDVVGDHTVIFAGLGERVELAHKVSSRETFANGALLAATWVNKKLPGLYSMEHVLGLV